MLTKRLQLRMPHNFATAMNITVKKKKKKKRKTPGVSVHVLDMKKESRTD